MASGVPANTVPTEESLRLEDERAFFVEASIRRISEMDRAVTQIVLGAA